MKQFFIVLLACNLASCKAVMSKIYGLNKEMKFHNAQEYLQFMQEKKKFPIADIIVPDSASYSEFIYLSLGPTGTVLFGSFLNDSTALKKSATLQEQVGCMGRVLGDLQRNIEGVKNGDTSLLESGVFRNLKFRQAANGAAYVMNDETKPLKVFLLYYYSAGRAFDKQYKEIFDFAAKHEKDVVVKIIATDKIATTL